jgi:hypothetical protein
MRYTLIFVWGLFYISFVTSAQSTNGIRRADAFFVERMPGNIRADESGKEVVLKPDTIHSIYLESGGSLIKWTSAWKDGQRYSITSLAMNDTPVEIGISKSTNEKIILKPGGRNKLWLLQLTKTTASKLPVKAKKGEIILQGRAGKKTIIHRISRETELEPIPSV